VPTENPYAINIPKGDFGDGKKDNINYALMHRLAAGAKIKVDKSEMRRLTRKNFEELPENRMKKVEEQKRAEAMER
jgi:hypothetical protein